LEVIDEDRELSDLNLSLGLWSVLESSALKLDLDLVLNLGFWLLSAAGVREVKT